MNNKVPKVVKSHAVLYISFGIIFIIGFLFSQNIINNIENKFYDILLHLKKEPAIAQELLFVDIDDISLNEIGTWPWTRDVVADALLRMRELGAYSAVFDIEYLSPSQKGLNPQEKEEFPYHIQQGQDDISSILTEFAAAIAAGNFSAQEAPQIAESLLQDNVTPIFNSLYETAAYKLDRDNDDYFAKALQFFGNSYVTVNYGNIYDSAQESKEYTEQRFLINTVTDPENLISQNNQRTIQMQHIETGFSPAMLPFMQHAQGAGFTNVVVDPDGSRRRIELLYQYNGKYLPQLVFAPILNLLNTTEMQRTDNALIIKNALFPNQHQRQDITIPLDRDGRMLINWLHDTDYHDSFRHEPIVYLLQLDAIEKKIVECLHWFSDGFYIVDENGGWLPYYQPITQLIQDYKDIRQLQQHLLSLCKGFNIDGTAIDGGISESDYELYFSARSAFFNEAQAFAQGPYLQQIQDRLNSMADEIDVEQLASIQSVVQQTFSLLQQQLQEYLETFSIMQKIYQNSFCIIGNSATSTTDMGATPFAARYPNVGTHGNIYNTIITQSFIKPVWWVIPFTAASLLLIAYILLTTKVTVFIQNLSGLLLVLLVPAVCIAAIRWFSVYLPFLPGFAILFLGYLATAAYRYMKTDHDKKFLRQAFSTYLTKDVVNDILKDPEKLSLGGTEKNITAFFTDIKSFSTLSEQVTPVQLVSILNEYLTAMSDVILEQRGTIDKYIGDAIVAFFGAPVSFDDHAYRACASAIRIKQLESDFNRRHLADGSIPMPIYTRIGINTGKMVVGNMGTNTKMNYTIMGNNVNIAARLEGVNKMYASWILISESTWKEIEAGAHQGEITVRRFDRVRVVGINTPVQLYNPIGFTADISQTQRQALNLFHKGLELYEQKQFTKALPFFTEADALTPEDGAANLFAERCKNYIETPPEADWDGVINLTSK